MFSIKFMFDTSACFWSYKRYRTGPLGLTTVCLLDMGWFQIKIVRS